MQNQQTLAHQSLAQLLQLCQSLKPPSPASSMVFNGTVEVETNHHRWHLVFRQGDLSFIDEPDYLINTLMGKLKSLRQGFPELQKISDRSPRPELYQVLANLLQGENVALAQALRAATQENLLAIFLEPEFNLTLQPEPQLAQLPLPSTPLDELVKATDRTANQWRTLLHVRHPFQKVALLDAEDPIANVPLFASVTNGKFRISEIADRFGQDISRTAIKLDRLAEKRTIAILPLPTRPPQVIPSESFKTKQRIFIVDDSPILLKQLASLIESWGYEVSITSNATTAIAQMIPQQPAIIFLDLNMPGTNGFELIKQIRRQPELNLTPLVMITAENNVANSFRAKWANCRFLAKPKATTDTAEFRSQLRSLLRELAPLPTDTLV
ncbi:MAG: response regulator [Pseudanabaenaceae cyanobacterium bins.68]|nr:response regulator [Pseudanabaenaceae cyanobacterium bins.68]